LVRLGSVEWTAPWDKVYALTLLIAYALIVALG